MTANKHLKIVLIALLLVVFGQTAYITTSLHQSPNCDDKTEVREMWIAAMPKMDVLPQSDEVRILHYLNNVQGQACYDW